MNYSGAWTTRKTVYYFTHHLFCCVREPQIWSVREFVSHHVSAGSPAAELRCYGHLSSGNLTKNRRNPTSQTPDSGHKKFNSRLVAPTLFSREPLGQEVEE